MFCQNTVCSYWFFCIWFISNNTLHILLLSLANVLNVGLLCTKKTINCFRCLCQDVAKCARCYTSILCKIFTQSNSTGNILHLLTSAAFFYVYITWQFVSTRVYIISYTCVLYESVGIHVGCCMQCISMLCHSRPNWADRPCMFMFVLLLYLCMPV